jgi:hypothetical protein
MRTSAIGLIIALAIIPGAALAQTGAPSAEQGAPPAAPSAAAPAPPPGAVTREEFVQRRADAAGRLFDQIDTNHLGYITRAQLRAWMSARRRGPASTAAPSDQQ